LDHGHIGRLGALEHPAGIDTKLTIRLVNTGAIAYQAAIGGKAFPPRDRGHLVACRERDYAWGGDIIQGAALTNRAAMWCCANIAKAGSMSLVELALTMTSVCPNASAAACASLVASSEVGSFGLTRKPSTAALGTSSCSNSTCLAAKSLSRKLTPVMLSPGWARLATTPSLSGSPPIAKTMGMVWGTTGLALTTEPVPPVATKTFTPRRTRSLANAGTRSICPSAKR